ncbi:MAG: hydantoinase/oxoprolinase family protein [Hyphomicrobiaceae bacterium]
MARLVGVDIGGTNTDLVFIDTTGQRLVTTKVPSTPANQAEGLMSGIGALGVDLDAVDLLVHGTTVATNAVIERKGARCGLITTAGFRDVLELRRRDRPMTYGLVGSFRPLIERRFRREVGERIAADGEVLTPLDADEVKRAASALRDEGCEVLVIAFLNSYAQPAHEIAAAQAAREVWATDFIVTSSSVMPAVREFERTSTAVVSGYVQPLIGHYLKRLGQRLATDGYRKDLLVVQSNGGVMGSDVASRFAANTILSGPAAGVTAGAAIARELGLENAISCDMGGTSLDVCVIRKGAPDLTQQKMLDFGIPLCVPMLDADAIGAGGGSLARLDAAGILQVGPESAGAVPGPVAFGTGGTVPTITDANVAIGILAPQTKRLSIEGNRRLDRKLALEAIESRIGKPLGLDAAAAADAIVTVATAKMGGHIRRRLLEKGLDPRDFSIIAFGGAGPLHANRLVREVGLKNAVIPWMPGLTSALGCLLGQLRHDFSRTVNMVLSRLDASLLSEVCTELADEGRQLLLQEGASSIDIRYGADMCYRGQTHVIQVDLGGPGRFDAAAVRAAFEASYRNRYGMLLKNQEIRLVNVRVTVVNLAAPPELGGLIRVPTGVPPKPDHAPVFFGGRMVEATVWERQALPVGFMVEGPAILLQPDATCFVEPGYAGTVHVSGNLIIEVQE